MADRNPARWYGRGYVRLFLILVTALFIYGCSGGAQVKRDEGPGRVVVYTRTGCPYCAQARKYLTAHQVPFVEYDIFKTEKGKRDFQTLKGVGVPIFIVGDKRMDGYDENRLAVLLKEQGFRVK
ncbi:hypothetical protein GMLC_09390 [Geomonas limicola]|uniref:Glutaredoxin domain-containing protein n=1 Tax=Geomonas limicola TaxID=2740186 RepID=A0A6V8N4Q5_9BACT|nr:glutaredoxin family protein [Geomonas limicola]GFO67360.1 hypothetical protein GMLC_09390 [Geomonas limicola]